MVYHLPFDEEVFRAYATARKLPALPDAVIELARAIAGSPGWERFPGCRLLVDPAAPRLALLGLLNETQKSELAVQADALASRCRHFRALSDAEATAVCSALAQRLRELVIAPEWRDAHLTAIPRGGWIVLERVTAQLSSCPVAHTPPADPNVPLIVLDDCAYTGTRFREFLSGASARHVAFASMYSSPRLRQTIREREPRVRACLSAEDLRPAPVAGDPETWRRVRAAGYLADGLEVVCLPWKEPDRAILQPGTALPLPAWRLIPHSDERSTLLGVALPVVFMHHPAA